MADNKKIGKYVAIGLAVVVVAAAIYWTPKIVKKVKEKNADKNDDALEGQEPIDDSHLYKGEYTLGAITKKGEIYGQNMHGIQVIEKSKKPETVINNGDKIRIEGNVPFAGNYIVRHKKTNSMGYTYLFVVLQGHNDSESTSRYQKKAKIRVYA